MMNTLQNYLGFSRGFNWGVGIFLIAYHIFLLIALPIYFWNHAPATGTVISAIILYFLTGLSITAGYHRYFSHRTYKAHSVIEKTILFFGSMAGQGSALRWSYDHRLHHAYVDTDNDPYSIKKGFWYAHFLWMLEAPRPIEKKVAADLLNNRWVVLQHRFIGTSMLLTNLIAFFTVGWLFDDYLGACFIAVWLRLLCLHHSTWFINSLAHTWGDKPFCQEQSAVNNYILSFLTFGEGYHNYHHTFANDYRNGIRWYHYDPTKWLIWILHRLKLSYDLRAIDEQTIKKRLVLERKALLINKLENIWYVRKEELEKKVQELADRLLEHTAAIAEMKAKYLEFKEGCDPVQILREIKRLRKSIRNDWRHWRRLSHNILNLKPI